MRISAAGDGVRQWDDLLASPARVAGSWSLVGVASDPAESAGSCGSDRSESGEYRQLHSPSQGAEQGGLATEAVGPNLTDRSKPGTKHHLVSDRQGVPLASLQTGANVNEGTVLLDVIDAIPPIKQPTGPPRQRPDKLYADKAYESQSRSAALEQRGISPRIARTGIESKTKLGRHRWVIERAFSWLHRNRRLLVRYERRDNFHEAFLHLGSALICWHFAADLFCEAFLRDRLSSRCRSGSVSATCYRLTMILTSSKDRDHGFCLPTTSSVAAY